MAEDGNSGMQNTIRDISIAELIAAPLKAAADAQRELAESTMSFIRDIGLSQNLQGKTYARTIAFNLSRMGQNGTENGLCIQAPLLALVPVPNLAVEEVDINFQMEVTSASKSVAEGTEDEQGLRVCGKVSSQAGNTRESNQSAKYQIQVKARKQDTPEGLSRILDILAQSVNPETEQHTGGTE